METSHRSEKTAGCVTHIGTSSTWAKQTPPQPTMLSLTYRPCLTGCQPLGSDSILSWYAARDCSKTAILPGSDGYKIAGRLWKGKRRTKKQQKNYYLPGTTSRKKRVLNSQRSYFTLFSSLGIVVGSYWCNWPAYKDKRKIYSEEEDFLSLQNGSISEGSQVPLICCRSSYWL